MQLIFVSFRLFSGPGKMAELAETINIRFTPRVEALMASPTLRP
jgi:hypothetical protein